VRSLGKDKVFALLLPEKNSSSSTTTRGEILAKHLGVPYEVKIIEFTLEIV
jgi:NAD+ synthase